MSGLHIVYGVMGGGKTNICVNKYLASTSYKKVICNVPLSDDFIKNHSDIVFELFDKNEPLQVIERISPENPKCFFIVDESQLVLTSLNVQACKDFAKRMTQIRQDDQEVFLIAQSAKLLPNMIKGLATDCIKCENLNVKGKKGYSKVTCYQGGDPFETKKIDDFRYKQIFGNYETSNWEDTQPPKDLFVKQKLKLLGILLFLVFFFLLTFFVSKKILNRHSVSSSMSKEDVEIVQNTIHEYKNSFAFDGECYRSFTCDSKGICYYMNGYGQYNIIPIAEMSKHRPCSLRKDSEGGGSSMPFPKK